MRLIERDGQVAWAEEIAMIGLAWSVCVSEVYIMYER